MFLLFLIGLWEQAEAPCLESIRWRRQLYGENNLKVAKCLCGLGGILPVLLLFIIFRKS